MSEVQIVPVILSGGSGSRLWPLSRSQHPKQFIALAEPGVSLLQATARRAAGLQASAPMIICNQEHRFMVAEQMREIGVECAAILLEPVGRNTAPAIAMAALEALAGGDDPLLLVLPADHVITDGDAFAKAVRVAATPAQDGKLLTFGVVPRYAETGYGYIRAAAQGASPVDAFVEKPDLATAESYLASGKYYWNSGMFLFRASRYLGVLEAHAPEILRACRNAHDKMTRDLDFQRMDVDSFSAAPAQSIDYAVMEKTDAAFVVPLDAGWSDVGAWDSLWGIAKQDERGNATRGDVLLRDAANCYVHAESRLVTALGVSDLVIVETADAVLVVPRSRTQDVKDLVEQLKAQGRPEPEIHRRVYRPWGFYENVDVGERFQAKRITVYPGRSLSLQMHHHRAEHWVVVSGTARITRGEEQFLLSENESTYIPIATKHRLENPGTIELEIIEVQSGSYLGEDDIVRFEDNYGRSE